MAMAASPMEAGPPHHNGDGDEDEDPLVLVLPQEVIEGLAELDLELSEGEVKNTCFKWQRFYFYFVQFLMKTVVFKS